MSISLGTIMIKTTFYEKAFAASLLETTPEGVRIHVSKATVTTSGVYPEASGKTFPPNSQAVSDPLLFVPFSRVEWIAKTKGQDL